MTHDDAVELLHDYHRGEIEDRTRVELESHLAGCASCRAMSRTYDALYSSVNAEDTDRSEDHPTADAIVAFAANPGGLDPNAHSSIAGHLESCTRCGEEAGRTTAVSESIRLNPDMPPAAATPRPWASRRAVSWVAAVAATLVLALAYPAYLGLFRLPELERALSWSGPVELNILSSTQREEAGVPTVTIDKDQPYVAIAVQTLVPRALADSELLRFEIDRTDGANVWATDLDAGTVRAEIRTSGIVTLLVPAARLEPDRYRLELLPLVAPDERPLLRVEFAVVSKE